MELLDTADPAGLDRLVTAVLHAQGATSLPAELQGQLRTVLGVVARVVVPIAGRPTGLSTARTTHAIAQRSGRLLGIELEGLSAEDVELAAARQLVKLIRFAGVAATQTAPRLPPGPAALAAVLLAARRFAPGLAPRLATALTTARPGGPTRPRASQRRGLAAPIRSPAPFPARRNAAFAPAR